MLNHKRFAAGFCAFFIFVLYPFFTTGFHFDDWFNSLIPYQLEQRGESLWQFTWGWMEKWWNWGRFYPLGQILLYPIWNFIGASAISYRIYQMAMVALNLFLFSKLLSLYGWPKAKRWLVCALVIGLFQLRKYHDPVVGYTGLLQWVALWVFGALYFYRKIELGETRLRNRICVILFFACGVLTYELCIMTLPLVFGLARVNPERKEATSQSALQMRWILAGIGLTYVAFTIWLRSRHGVGYEGVKLSLGIKAIVTYLWQSTSALPLMYPIFGRSGFYGIHTFFEPPLFAFTTFLFACAMVAFWHVLLDLMMKDLSLSSTDKTSVWSDSQRRFSMWIGLMLWLVPPFFVAIVEKYQREIARPGHAYLPVYLSYFGVAILLALWIDHVLKARLALSEKKKSEFLAVWAIAIGLGFTFSQGFNRVAAEKMNLVWKYPRELLEGANRAGLFAEIPDGATLLGNQGFDWTDPVFFKTLTGKDFKLSLYDTYFVDHSSLPSDSYFLRFEVKNAGLGMVIFSKIKRVIPLGPSEPRKAKVLSDGPVVGIVYATDLDLVFRFSGKETSGSDFGLVFERADPFKRVDPWRVMQFPAAKSGDGSYEVSSIDLEVNSLESEMQ